MVSYKELNNKIVDLLNNIILSHQIEFSDILSDCIKDMETSSDSIGEKKYISIDKDKEIRKTIKNYNKLLVNNGILIEEILKRI